MRPIDRLAIALLLVIGSLSGLAFLAKFDWRLELLTHWRVHYLVASILLLGVYSLARRRRYRIVALATVVICVNGSAIVPRVLKRPQKAESAVRSEQFQVALVNVLYQNRNYTDTLSWLREMQPDVVVLVELTSEWQKAISSINDVFPFQTAVPAGLGDGIGLISRHPLTNPKILWPTFGRPAVAVELQLPRTSLTIVGAHPKPPTSARLIRQRDEYLANLGQMIANLRRPVLVAGDLNTTPWSYAFDEFTQIADLSLSGIQPSWPAGLGYAGIPIDHILGNQDVWVFDIKPGPAIGSDHRPIVASVRVAPGRM
jgi:endonuclease/exonuclease/phosphatase (EEP) superfamily protein YafD